jgi:RHS repeat-associated protein
MGTHIAAESQTREKLRSGGKKVCTVHCGSFTMNCMVASSIPCKLSLCADRAHACAGDSYVSSAINVACPTTQSVLAIASPHELHGDSWPSSSTGTRSFCCNQQYSVTAVTTSTGSIAERYAYSAYGQPTVLDASASVLSSSAINNRYKYTGREWDATLGLHHFRARWMSPSAGRFLTRDPIGYVDGLSLYRVYFHSQSADPLGEYQVTVQTNAFIPYGLLMIDPWSDVEGDDRDVSFEPLGPESSRAFSRAVVEMEECIQKDPLVSSSSTISDSHMRTWNGHEERRFTARGGFRAKVTAVRTGPCSVQVHMQMHAWLPFIFVPMAPAIDWDLTYDLHFFEIEGHGVRVTGNLSGSHDGFPAYEGFVQGKRVYDHDPRLTGDWIASLFPPMEYSPNKSFMVVDSNGKASCCGCKEKNPLAP